MRALAEGLLPIQSSPEDLDYILAHLREGVIILGADERVLRCNRRALTFLNLSDDVLGNLFPAADLHPELPRLIERARRERFDEGTITLRNGESERILQISVSTISGTKLRSPDLLIGLIDISRMHHLEKMRRDFIANVSHELRTPITSIQGAVETLLDNTYFTREETERFLKIISRHSARLTSLIEDLLKLSRLEHDARAGQVGFNRTNLADVIRSALQLCEGRARARLVYLRFVTVGELRADADVNFNLLEQAIVNLVDNAIEHSPERAAVTVTLSDDNNSFAISVNDAGCGIPEEHLGRVFERFYRVDSGRSRTSGGTGIGLAIVKHVALAHHGNVRVESRIGEGSSFSILLPRPNDE